MNIAIVSNGTITNYPYIKEKIKEYDYIICADGGINHVYNMGLKPDLIVGDLDSAASEIINYFKKLNISIEKFPDDKDFTDTHLAIEMAFEKKPKSIALFGVTGNRLDHTLSNIDHLLYIRQNKIKGIVIDDYNEIFLANDYKTIIKGNKNDIVSFVSLSEKTEGITLEGFKYPLHNKLLYKGDSLCISNVIEGPDAILYKGKGDLLIIKSKDE